MKKNKQRLPRKQKKRLKKSYTGLFYYCLKTNNKIGKSIINIFKTDSPLKYLVENIDTKDNNETYNWKLKDE